MRCIVVLDPQYQGTRKNPKVLDLDWKIREETFMQKFCMFGGSLTLAGIGVDGKDEASCN